jgi:hypothetical protein
MATTAQPRQTRTISSSHHAEQKPLSLRPLAPQAREAVASVVEGAIGTNWHVSHRMDTQKDGRALSSETFYAWRREGRERPGILALLDGDEPAVFWDMDRDEPNALRMQIPYGFTRAGPTLFVATLLRGERRLILEDIWMDAGKTMKSLPFSARWAALQRAYGALSAQQLYLGFDLVTVDPRPMQEFLTAAEPGTIWDFQPEGAGRKRLYYIVPGARVGMSAGAQARAAEARAHISMPAAVNKNVLKRTAQVLTIRIARLRQDPATTLPDSYVLEAADGVVVGKPTVTRMAQSKELRAALAAAPDGFPVEVGWHTDFKKYEVLRILPADSPLTSAGAFFENRGE